MTGVKAPKLNRKLIIARPFSHIDSLWTDGSATKTNRGERSANSMEARDVGNIAAPAVGSKPAKGKKSQECRRLKSPNTHPRLMVGRSFVCGCGCFGSEASRPAEKSRRSRVSRST